MQSQEDAAPLEARIQALRELGRRGDAVSVQELRDTLAEERIAFRLEAALALWTATGEPEPSLGVFREALRRPNRAWPLAGNTSSRPGAQSRRGPIRAKSVHHFAVEALARMGPVAASSVPELLSAVRAEASVLRASAARALGEVLGHADLVIPALTWALEDHEPWVRISAALALAEYGPRAKEAWPILQRLCEDPLDWVAQAAQGALAAVEGR